MSYDPAAKFRLLELLKKGGGTSTGTSRIQPVETRNFGPISPTTAFTSMRPLLKTPTQAERQAVADHLLSLFQKKPPAKKKSIFDTMMQGRRGQPPAPPRQARPPAPMPTPVQMTPPTTFPGGMQRSMAENEEIDVTPQAAPAPAPKYDSFHGHAPAFGGPQEDGFGDLEADLGLDGI